MDRKSVHAPSPRSAFQTPCVSGLRTGWLGCSALQQTPSSSARHAIGVEQTQSWLPKACSQCVQCRFRLEACLNCLWAEVQRLLRKTSSGLQRNGDTAFGLQCRENSLLSFCMASPRQLASQLLIGRSPHPSHSPITRSQPGPQSHISPAGPRKQSSFISKTGQNTLKTLACSAPCAYERNKTPKYGGLA